MYEIILQNWNIFTRNTTKLSAVACKPHGICDESRCRALDISLLGGPRLLSFWYTDLWYKCKHAILIPRIYLRKSWWRHQMEPFSALLDICAGISPGTGESPAQRPVTRGFDVFFDLRLNNGWVNNPKTGDLRRYRAHYDVTVMMFTWFTLCYVLLCLYSIRFSISSAMPPLTLRNHMIAPVPARESQMIWINPPHECKGTHNTTTYNIVH